MGLKAAGEVVPQALPPALTCFLRALLTLRGLAFEIPDTV
jgi:hypothetical protein